MARRVRWTQSALNDLDSIFKFIARDSRFYAATFVNKIKNASRSLSKMSLRARIVPEMQDDNIRELLIVDYRMMFRIQDNEIQIITIIHQARNLESFANQILDN